MNVGGTELNALRTARHLVARGVDLRVFSLSAEGPLLAEYAALGVPVHCLPIDGFLTLSAFRRGRELAGLVRREGVMVVHAHDSYSNIFAAPWARLAGAAFIASRRWWHGSRRRSRRWANRASYALAQRVLANSPAVAELLVREEKVPRARVVVVPNFLDEAAFAPPPPGWVDAFARELALPEDRLVVGVVASLQPVKDHVTLLRAVALLVPEFPHLYAVLVGRDGGSQAELQSLVGALGIAEHVRFAGERPSQPSAHHLFDVSVLTSRSEGLPNSILEAMAAGRPVVATDVGATADAVLPGHTGELVAVGDVTALASRLGELLRNMELRHRRGAAGRRRACEYYAAADALERLLMMYHQVGDQDQRQYGHE
jgi:glycosyltransferase involved in cell wall biosynthesis